MTPEYATLVCVNCHTEANHRLCYAGRLLVITTCLHCGHTIERDVRRRYLADLRQRVATKPARMLRRFRRHPVTFAGSLPRTTLTKPWKIVSELRLVWTTASHTQRREHLD